MVFFGLIRGMPGFRATRSAAALAAALVAASVLCAGAVPPPPPDPEWQHAENLCAKRLWADAEKAFLVYSRRVPEPPRRADALVKAGVCRLMLRDPSAARRHFEKAAYDEVARRKSPEAVAEAFDRLHALLLDEGKPASLRARVLDDCRHRLPACVVLPRMREREGDALLAVGRHRQSLDCYDAAGAGLSPGGTNVVRLLRECLAANPPPLAEADAVRLAAAAGAKPASAAALCALLAKRDEGWLGEDVQARLLMGSGKASEAAAVWEAMLRGRRGPADRIALSHCEALAAGEPTKGLEAFGAWLGRYPDSSLRERAEACYALLLAKHGDLAEAASRLESFLKEHPGSRYAPEVDQALATARNASKRLEQIKAEQAAKAGERRRDPALAEIEQAEALLSKGRYDGAVKVFMAFRNRRRHPLWGRAWFGLGKARHALGDTGGALAAWDDLWRRSLTDTNVLCAAEARRAAGDAWLEDFGDPVRALKAYDETAARAPAAGENASDLNHGLALLMLGRGAEAAAVFTRRRDAAGADKAEFLRWDNLVDLCADDRPAAPPRSLLPAERRAHADLVLADGLFAAGEHSRALKLYRRAAVPLAGREGADRCDLQAARTLAALGRTKDALALYARFESEHRQSPLAPAALLYAGTLCAAPGTSDFAKAREWFAKIIDNHPGTPEAEAAEFYTATLAWRGRKWAEAERLHKAFAANHPDSPLARVALDERLPAIAKKSLAVPLHDPVDRTVTVYVSPYDRKRKAIPIVNTNAFNAHLDIRPASGYVLVDSEITLQNSRRNISCLWTGPDPKTASLHRYHLAAAFSCEEYVQVDGTIARPTSGGSGRPPPFRVTVPSVDVDWEDFADWSHEDGEDARRVIVPLNTNRVDDIRWLWVQIPYDDYGIVHPFLTLHCVDANALCLLHEAGTSFPNGGQIDSRAVPSWPIRFRAEPLAPTTECIVRVLGEADNVTGEKAVDTIRARVVNVDLDVDANHDGAITVADEPLEETAGGYVCVGTNSLAPVKLTLEPKTGLPGKLTLSATMGDVRIQVWTNIARTSQMTLPKVWNAGEAVPGTLYVEGITPSAAARDVELRLEYDESPQGQSNPIFKCADVVRLTILSVEFIDEVPDYSLDSNTDSDNFFLREYDGSGNSDSEDLDIYFRILPEDVPVSDVKIKIYRGDTSTLETTLDGEKDASGDFKTGDNLHTNWTPSVTLADDHPGFYRVQLEVYVDGQTEPICQTSIDDADTSTPGWQCPQDCLAIHDLTWKHRPLVHVHEDEIGSPSSIVEFTVESGDSTGPRVKEWTGGGTPTVHPAGTIPTSVNSFWDLFFDDEVTDGDLSGFSAAERAILATDAGEETVYHSANTEDANNFVFLQFWMFENFSQRPFGIPFDLDPPNVQHEGDMEHCQIAVRLSDSADASLKAKWVVPFGATASQHYYAQTLKWDINDGSAPANAHSQEHVEHTDNRLAIYVALGAHATYFAADGDIEVPDVGGVLGTQQQYDPNPEGAYDVSGPADEIEYDLMHVDDVLLGSFEGRWGYLINGDPDSFSNGPSGPPHRAAHASGGAEVILKTRPQDLHNMSRKTSQMTEMNIP